MEKKKNFRGYSLSDIGAEWYLRRPRRAAKVAERVAERLMEVKARAEGSAVSYDCGGLGVHMQTAYGKTLEDGIMDILDLEYEYEMARLVARCERLTVTRAICQACSKQKQREVLIRSYVISPDASFEEIAEDMKYTSRSSVYMLYSKAMRKFAEFHKKLDIVPILSGG